MDIGGWKKYPKVKFHKGVFPTSHFQHLTSNNIITLFIQIAKSEQKSLNFRDITGNLHTFLVQVENVWNENNEADDGAGQGRDENDGGH